MLRAKLRKVINAGQRTGLTRSRHRDPATLTHTTCAGTSTQIGNIYSTNYNSILSCNRADTVAYLRVVSSRLLRSYKWTTPEQNDAGTTQQLGVRSSGF